ncbi:MAG: potassium channel family protein [Phycisphaeraceae bacterium]
MQRFTVIGLGRFGSRLAANLANAGQEVIGIDTDQRIIEEMRDRVTLAIAMDATDEQALRLQGIDQTDVAIVGIGGDFESIAAATVVLKQIGVPRVIARAISPTSARILQSIGADEVVNPEDETADRWANRLISPQFIRQFELDEGHSIVEIRTPKRWVERSLSELNVRARESLHVVAIRRRRDPSDETSPMTIQIPSPEEPLNADDVLVIMGRDADLAKLRDTK